MSDFVKKLHEERLRTWEQAKALLDGAAAEGRDLGAEEDAQYRAMSDRISEIDARVTQVTEDQKRAAASEEAFASLLAQRPAAPAAREAVDPNAELRAFARGERGRVLDVRPEQRTTNTLVKGTAADGGNTVRTDFYTRLVAHLIENSGVLQTRPTVLNTAAGEALQVPKTTAHSASASIVAEAATIDVNDPTFGQVTLNAYKYGFLMKVTHELLNDTSVDLMGYLSMQAGRALGNGFGAHLVSGTGTDQPQGVVTASTKGADGPTGASIDFDSMITLFYSIIAPYRNSGSCAWLVNDATMGVIRKLKDANQQYLYQPSLVAGTPDTLLGKPIYTDPNVDTVAATKKPVLFGDFSTYFVRRVEAIRFERSDDFAFDSDVVTFRTLLRGDGRQVDTQGPIKHLLTAAA